MQFTNINVKRGIFTFDEDDFHIALMHSYKRGKKICLYALNEQNHTIGLTKKQYQKNTGLLLLIASKLTN